MNFKINKLAYEDIKIGDVFSFEKMVDATAVGKFAEVSGDYNPLHMDDAYAIATPFGGRIIHGMFLASFFSTLVGMFCPGEHALYLSQDLKFKHPVKVGAKVVVRGQVVNKYDSTRVIEVVTTIIDGGRVVVEGLARVKVR